MPHALSPSRLIAASGVALLCVAIAAPAAAFGAGVPNPNSVDFASGYTLDASPNGQNGWTAAAGYDAEIVGNASYPASGLDPAGASLRVSNALFPGGAINHATSPQLEVADAAGETSTGATNNTFTADYVVAPTTGYVEGINVEVSVGHGTNRAGGILQFRHVGGKLELSTMWVVSDATDASMGDWRSVVLGTFDPAVAHDIRTITHFIDDGNDMTEVFVDGVSIALIPTWEYYHRVVNGEAKSARGLNFKGSPSAPSADGIGFVTGLGAVASDGLLFTDISYGASQVADWTPTPGSEPPVTPPAPSDGELVENELPTEAVSGEKTSYEVALGSTAAGQSFAIYHYSSPTFVGWSTADASGSLSITLPSGLPAGVHKVAIYDITGALVGWFAVTVLELAATGTSEPPVLIIAGGALLAAGVAIGLFARRTKRA
jgi:LPXTG-motif cell wall-anchored protein